MSILTEPTGTLLPAEAGTAARLRAEYGSRRGWLLHRAHALRLSLGGFANERSVDWGRVQQFVFVCRGNICRSPYAARRARAASLRAFSFGLDMGMNVGVDPTAATIARRRGLDLTQHQARDRRGVRVNDADLLVAMEPAHLRPLYPMADAAGAQVTLLGLWSTPRRPCLSDPYGLGEEYFNRCFMLIDSGIAGLAAAMAEAHRGH